MSIGITTMLLSATLGTCIYLYVPSYGTAVIIFGGLLGFTIEAINIITGRV